MNNIQEQALSQLSIPEDHMLRFLHNMTHQGEWWISDKAHEEWMIKYYKTYKNFIVAVKRTLLVDVNYKPAAVNAATKRVNEKDLYLISYDGLKQLEMACDKQTQLYYIQLENCMQQLANKQLQDKEQQILAIEQEKLQQQSLIIAQQKQIESYKKTGLVYGISVIENGQSKIIYVGKSYDYMVRQREHEKQIKQFYERNEGLMYYVPVVYYHMKGQQLIFDTIEDNIDESQLADREKHYQDLYGTNIRQGNLQKQNKKITCECGAHYCSKGAFKTHLSQSRHLQFLVRSKQ